MNASITSGARRRDSPTDGHLAQDVRVYEPSEEEVGPRLGSDRSQSFPPLLLYVGPSPQRSVSTVGILIGMPPTTIKVDSSVRDRLAAVARARGTTMGALLEAESRRLESEQRWTDIEAAYLRLQRNDPTGWQDYLAELGELTAGEPDATAGEEWPEYNP